MMFKSKKTKELSKELTQTENELIQEARGYVFQDEKNINIADLESFNKKVLDFNKKVEFCVQRSQLEVRDGKVKAKKQ